MTYMLISVIGLNLQMDASVSELLWNVAIVFYIYFNLSSVSQSSLSRKFWVYKKVKLFLASVSSSRMVTCLLLVSFSIWRSVWFYFLFPVCVRVCVCVCVRPLPVHTTSLALFILSLIFYAFNSPPFTFLSFLVFFFYPPSLFFIILFFTSVMCPLVSQ